jgi:hypothetical protein
VWVNDEGSYLDGGQYKLYAVDEQYGYIDYDGKAWYVPFDKLEWIPPKQKRNRIDNSCMDGGGI